MTLSSCLYVGSVMHHRLRPKTHRLRYRVFWMLLDLDEIDVLPAKLRLFSHNSFNLVSFHDRDHGDGTDVPLRLQIENLLRRAGCDSDRGRIELFCMPRIAGYAFNPLSVYFCRRRDGSLDAIIYEVHNTFGQRHSYVIPCDGAAGGIIAQHCSKAFYVSPFLGMDLSYTFRVQPPGADVTVAINTRDDSGPVLSAALSGTRIGLSDANLLRVWLSHPLLTLKVILAIHWQALRMVLKGFRFHPRGQDRRFSVTIVASNGAPR